MPLFRKKDDDKKKQPGKIKTEYSAKEMLEKPAIVRWEKTEESDTRVRWVSPVYERKQRKYLGKVYLTLYDGKFLEGIFSDMEKDIDYYFYIETEKRDVRIGSNTPCVHNIARMLPFAHQMEELSATKHEFYFSKGELVEEWKKVLYPEEKVEALDISKIDKETVKKLSNFDIAKKMFDVLLIDLPDDTNITDIINEFKPAVKGLINAIK